MKFTDGLALGFVLSGLLLAGQMLLANAFDDPSSYARQGYHQCDSPSGWCAKGDTEQDERDEKPCGGKR